MCVDLWARAQQQRWEEPQYLLEARAGCIRCHEASGEERRDRSGHGAWRGAAVLTRQLRAEVFANNDLCTFCWPHPGTVGVASPSTYTQVGIGLGSIQRVGHPTLGTDISTSNYPRTPNLSPQGKRIMQMSPM